MLKVLLFKASKMIQGFDYEKRSGPPQFDSVISCSQGPGDGYNSSAREVLNCQQNNRQILLSKLFEHMSLSTSFLSQRSALVIFLMNHVQKLDSGRNIKDLISQWLLRNTLLLRTWITVQLFCDMRQIAQLYYSTFFPTLNGVGGCLMNMSSLCTERLHVVSNYIEIPNNKAWKISS